jgi:hypothetical protein
MRPLFGGLLVTVPVGRSSRTRCDHPPVVIAVQSPSGNVPRAVLGRGQRALEGGSIVRAAVRRKHVLDRQVE